MKFLLDAHILIWAIYAPNELSARVRAILEDRSNTLLVSDSALWEFLNKVGRGRLLLTTDSVSTVVEKVTDLGVQFVPIERAHVVAAASLPHHHHDPFDRMLIAQASALSVPLISVDADVRKYAIEVIW